MFCKKVFLKIIQNSLKTPELESLSNTAKGLQAVRPATLLKRNPSTDVNQPSYMLFKIVALESFTTILE